MSPKTISRQHLHRFLESWSEDAFSFTSDPSLLLSALYEVHVCVSWNLCFNQATFCSPHCTQTEQGCQPVMLCNISHKSFNSSEQTLLIMAKWNENVDFRKRPGAIRSQMSIKCFGLWRRHGWVTGLFMKSPLLMKQDRFCQTCQDLWYVDRDYFSNHLWEADLGGQRLSLNKEVECKLMELFHRL